MVERWERLSAPQVGALAQNDATVLWAIGATEQHGPHLATGFDHVVAATVVDRAAEALGETAAVVLPALAVGVSSHWTGLGGTLSVSADALQRVLQDVCESVHEAGFSRVVIVNGHAGNIPVGLVTVAAFPERNPLVELVSYWELADSDAVQAARRVDAGIGHAGEWETSIGMCVEGLVVGQVAPDLGRPLDPLAPGGSRATVHRALSVEHDTQRTGVVGDPRAATRELGEAILASATRGLVEHCRAPRPTAT